MKTKTKVKANSLKKKVRVRHKEKNIQGRNEIERIREETLPEEGITLSFPEVEVVK
jgi:hypothetical protein